MKLDRPLAIFDIESTGTDVVKDRIVTLAIDVVLDISHAGAPALFRFNPGVEMCAEAIAIHGIKNEMVKEWPSFKDNASSILEMLEGCDLAGFNLLNFDIPILWEELNRSGIQWDLTGVRVIDAGNIFKKKEDRTLSAAVKFYCGRDHGAAHDACGDVLETAAVIEAQLKRYADLSEMSIDQLSEFSLFEKRFDLAGKITLDKDGFPTYAFGKSKGVRVADDPGFARWMMRNDFPTQTKIVLSNYLKSLA
jgi:DNA polymerase-3 subunit epsilon